MLSPDRCVLTTPLAISEYLNASNTGKLLLSTPHAKLFILGIEEQERELVRWIADELDRTLVLFPSRDSITVDQLEAKRASAPDASGALLHLPHSHELLGK